MQRDCLGCPAIEYLKETLERLESGQLKLTEGQDRLQKQILVELSDLRTGAATRELRIKTLENIVLGVVGAVLLTVVGALGASVIGVQRATHIFPAVMGSPHP